MNKNKSYLACAVPALLNIMLSILDLKYYYYLCITHNDITLYAHKYSYTIMVIDNFYSK